MLPTEAGIFPPTSQGPSSALRIRSTDKLSRGRSFRFLGTLRSLEGISVAARDRSNAASDVLVHFVGQIGQGHAQRPVWRFEAPTVQQNNPVILGQTEGKIQRM